MVNRKRERVASRQRQTQRDINKQTYSQRCTGADRDKPRQTETRRRQTDADVDRPRQTDTDKHGETQTNADRPAQTNMDIWAT